MSLAARIRLAVFLVYVIGGGLTIGSLLVRF